MFLICPLIRQYKNKKTAKISLRMLKIAFTFSSENLIVLSIIVFEIK